MARIWTELPELRKFVADLEQEDATVAVEGKRDARALRLLGFGGTLMQFHSYGGFVRFADAASEYNRVVLLFDYDHKGRYMTYRMVRLLQRRTHIDLRYRRRLARITKGRVKFVEQLAGYV